MTWTKLHAEKLEELILTLNDQHKSVYPSPKKDDGSIQAFLSASYPKKPLPAEDDKPFMASLCFQDYALSVFFTCPVPGCTLRVLVNEYSSGLVKCKAHAKYLDHSLNYPYDIHSVWVVTDSSITAPKNPPEIDDE